MNFYREQQSVISEDTDHFADDSELGYGCEQLNNDRDPSGFSELGDKVSDCGIDERAIDSDDGNSTGTYDIFGDDWIGKPGVSTGSSDSDDLAVDEDIVKSRKRIIRSKSIPSHISVLEGDPVTYKCTVCVKTFGSKGHIGYHAYCGQGDKPFKCSLCSKSFSKKNLFSYHIKTHTGEKPFTCSICNKKFLQLDKLRRHKRIHSGNTYECSQCEAKFRDTYSLNVHKRTTHGERSPYIHKCHLCTKSFKDKSTLNKHVRGVHSGTKNFICEHCGKAFDWKYNLICHVRTHSGLRAFTCNQCSRTFKNQNDCRKHQVTHTDDREYRCDVCRGTFKRRDNLVRHLRNIHPEYDRKKITKEPPGGDSTSHRAPDVTAPSDSNRISVIRNLNPSHNTDSSQQSVIKHSSGNTHQQISANIAVRECVIKSTK